MKILLLLAIVALDPRQIWLRMTRETNSLAASRQGQEAYAAKQYPAAVQRFETAERLKPTTGNAFNLGTSQIAGGKRVEGSATLARAIEDPSLRAAALYNRGNSALSASAWDHAIRDFTESLRIRPGSAEAKRNLEIARLRKRQSEQSQSSSQKGQGGEEKKQPSQEPPQRDPAQRQPGEISAESLLRAVHEQEQEELARMRRARPQPRRVGW